MVNSGIIVVTKMANKNMRMGYDVTTIILLGDKGNYR